MEQRQGINTAGRRRQPRALQRLGGAAGVRRVRFVLLMLVGNMAFYTANSLFLGPLAAFIDYPVPEGKRIAADTGFAAQAGNVLLLLFMLVPHAWTPPARPALALLSLLAVACPLALALAWRQTLHGHSVVILGVGALAGALGVLCNVVGWAWAERFGNALLPALSGGMAAAALVPSLISVVMNPGNHARFGVDVFFFIAAGFTSLGAAAWAVLEYVPPLCAPPGPGPAAAATAPDSPGAAAGRLRREESSTDDLDASDATPVTVAESVESVESVPLLLQAKTPAAGVPPVVLLLRPLRLTPAANFIARMASLAWIASIIFGWQPGIIPYLVPSSRIVAFQVAGQTADVLGRSLAGLQLFHNQEFNLALLCTASFVVQISLALAADQSHLWYTVVQSIVNALFSLTYGVASTRFVMSASAFTSALRNPKVTEEQSRRLLMQRMGACISLGIGLAGILAYFVVHYGIDR